jgi:hypothetical protein
VSKDEVVRALGELTKVLRETNRVFRDLVKISEVVNQNIVEIERRRTAPMGIDGIENLKPVEKVREACNTCITDNCSGDGFVYSENCPCCMNRHGVSPKNADLSGTADGPVQ